MVFAVHFLQQLARQLESHANVTDTSERMRIHSSALRSGILFQNLGAMLLELGRTTMTLRMGETPVCSLAFFLYANPFLQLFIHPLFKLQDGKLKLYFVKSYVIPHTDQATGSNSCSGRCCCKCRTGCFLII